MNTNFIIFIVVLSAIFIYAAVKLFKNNISKDADGDTVIGKPLRFIDVILIIIAISMIASAFMWFKLYDSL